ncbi:amino acid/polyamine transporter I [Xylaria arbuscula]|nr:amino acid/polyamine transporter I [Xylaria arbuscula]
MNAEGRRISPGSLVVYVPLPFRLSITLPAGKLMPSYGTMGTSSSDIKDPEHDVSLEVTAPDGGPPDTADGESVGNIQKYDYDDSRKIGITGATFLILNKMIGTGIFSTPSSIFQATGSVGVSLFLWVIGGVLTFCGLSVWLEFGLAIPRSGGEKNYLERVYRHPRYLATCVLAAQIILLGFSSGNSLAFGEYVLAAANTSDPSGWKARGIGAAAITFSVSLHAFLPKWGIRLFNVLGVFKVVILVFIVFSGFAALAGHRRIPNPHNFDNAFKLEVTEDYGGTGAYGYANALLSIIYSYKGWENANYVVSELKHPRKTLAVAAPLAVGGVTILYVLANVAYFAAIPKKDLATSEALVAALFFKNIFGDSAGARSLPVFVALSNIGNVLAVSFAHARLNQEFGKEALLPFSRFWASIKPSGAHFKKSENWSSPWHTFLPISVLYLLANIFLAVTPFIPPTNVNADGYPYYVFPVVGVGVLLLGVFYWVCWTKIWPAIGGYKIVATRIIDDDGVEAIRYRKIKNQ